MLKKLVLIATVLSALLAFTSPVLAQGVPTTYYVDTAYTGTEVGTQAQPFNTLAEATAAAQAQPYGGYIYTKTNGTWAYWGYVAPVYPPDTGSPLSGPALFALLALLSIGLILGGWYLLRRSRARAHLV
jgi:hypothetical protein